MKKSEFLIRVREQGRRFPHRVADMAYTLAVNVDEDTLPDDLDAAASRLVTLVARVKRAVPAQ
jgi:hypothetical protein